MKRTTILATGETGAVKRLFHGLVVWRFIRGTSADYEMSPDEMSPDYKIAPCHDGGGGFVERRAGGFTLVEMLVVIAILSTLFGLVVVTVGSITGRAQQKASVSLFLRMQSWIDEYRSLTGFHPRDGLDSRVRIADGGTLLRGSAALYYQLSRSVITEEIYGSRVRPREYPKVGEFGGREVTEEDEEFPGAQEILDGWGNPFHYDNTEDGRFRPQDGSVHYPAVDEEFHPEDPRTGELDAVAGVKPVERSGIQSLGYALWSHGTEGHKDDDERSLPLASWNIGRFQQ